MGVSAFWAAGPHDRRHDGRVGRGLQRLLACDAVPLGWRRIYALATYFFCRASELRTLSWANLDLEHGTVSVRLSFDVARGEHGASCDAEDDAQPPSTPRSGPGIVQNPLSARNHCGGAGNRTRVREASSQPSFTCVVAFPKRRGSWIRPRPSHR